MSTVVGQRDTREFPGAGRKFPHHRKPFRRRGDFRQSVIGIMAKLMDSDRPSRNFSTLAWRVIVIHKSGVPVPRANSNLAIIVLPRQSSG